MARKTMISKEVILQKALQMLIRNGYSSINIKTLSQEIGCSTQPLVWHFENMEGLRNALAEYAITYANRKIAPTAEDAIEAFDQVITSYIQIALHEPHLFKFLYMNSDSASTLADNVTLKNDNSFEDLTMRLSKAYSVPVEKIARYMQHTIIYTHGVATLIVAGIIKETEEETMKMIACAKKTYRMMEGISSD